MLVDSAGTTLLGILFRMLTTLLVKKMYCKSNNIPFKKRANEV